MSERPPTVVVAFDGSDESRHAVAVATDLFPAHCLAITTVWEPGLAMTMQYGGPTDPTGMAYLPPMPEQVEAVDRAQEAHATAQSQAGADLAGSLGAEAEPVALVDTISVAETLLAYCDARAAKAIVVGARGLGAVKSRLFGSTSKRLLQEARLPIVVVHPQRDDDER